jgi:hypothetical protein
MEGRAFLLNYHGICVVSMQKANSSRGTGDITKEEDYAETFTHAVWKRE